MLKSKCLCCNDSFSVVDAKRIDPTGTLTLRAKLESNLVARFNRIKGLINQSLVQSDALGLKAQRIGDSIKPMIVMDAQALPARAFAFDRPAEKVERFMGWLQEAQNDNILEIQQGASMSSAARSSWMNTYIDSAYSKGVRDAANKMRKGGASIAESWTQQSFFRPIHADRLGLIYTRAYSDLDGITKTMDQQISRILAQGIGEGKGPLDIARQINNRVDKIGITRARALARSEIVSAHAEATLNSYEEAGLSGVEVEAEFTTAGDSSVCFECEALQGKIFTIAESRGMIPVHVNCLPGDSLVLSRSGISATSKRWFDGDMIIIKSASGRVLSCTPNHPVLTDIGWVAAQDVNLSHKVICDGGSEWMAGADDDHKNVVSSIHDVSESFRSSGEVSALPVPMTSEDFHGDGTAGEIAVVWANGKLRDAFSAARSEFANDKSLNGGVVLNIDRVSFGSLALFFKSVLSSSSGIVRRLNLIGPFRFAHVFPFFVARLGRGSEGDAAILKPVIDSASADTKLASKLISGLSCEVFSDDVVSIKREFFSGHVYNLETGEGWYSANGIITHNCRCAFNPIVVGGTGIELI